MHGPDTVCVYGQGRLIRSQKSDRQCPLWVVALGSLLVLWRAGWRHHTYVWGFRGTAGRGAGQGRRTHAGQLVKLPAKLHSSLQKMLLCVMHEAAGQSIPSGGG